MDLLKLVPARSEGNRNLMKMQLRVILAGLVVIIIMGIFPPWNYTLESQEVNLLRPAGYAPIFSPPEPPAFIAKTEVYGMHMDVGRLLIQWVLVGLAVTVILLFLRLRYLNKSEAAVSPTGEKTLPPEIEQEDAFLNLNGLQDLIIERAKAVAPLPPCCPKCGETKLK